MLTFFVAQAGHCIICRIVGRFDDVSVVRRLFGDAQSQFHRRQKRSCLCRAQTVDAGEFAGRDIYNRSKSV